MQAKGGAFKEDFNYGAKDIRFTTKGNNVYAIFLGWPGNGAPATIISLGSKEVGTIKSVTMLATGEPVKWNQDEAGLHITMPGKTVGDHAYVLKITLGSPGGLRP